MNEKYLTGFDYEVYLTGAQETPALTDLVLQAATVQFVLRPSPTESYINVVIPYVTAELLTEITSRTNGYIKLRRSTKSVIPADNGIYLDGFEIDYEYFGYAIGGRNTSTTIIGQGVVQLEKAIPDTYTVTRHEKKFTSRENGITYLNFEGPDIAFYNVYPGDTVGDGVDSGVVDIIEGYISPKSTTMRVRVS